MTEERLAAGGLKCLADAHAPRKVVFARREICSQIHMKLIAEHEANACPAPESN